MVTGQVVFAGVGVGLWVGPGVPPGSTEYRVPSQLRMLDTRYSVLGTRSPAACCPRLPTAAEQARRKARAVGAGSIQALSPTHYTSVLSAALKSPHRREKQPQEPEHA